MKTTQEIPYQEPHQVSEQAKTYYKQPDIQESKAIKPVIGQNVITEVPAQTFKPQEQKIILPNQPITHQYLSFQLFILYYRSSA